MQVSGKLLPVHIKINLKCPACCVRSERNADIPRPLQVAIVSKSCQVLVDAAITLRCALVQAEFRKQRLDPSACPPQPRDRPLVYQASSFLLLGFVLLFPSIPDVQLSANGKHSEHIHLASRIALLLDALIAVQAGATRYIWRAQPAGLHPHPPSSSSAGSSPAMVKKTTPDQQQQQHSDQKVTIAASEAI